MTVEETIKLWYHYEEIAMHFNQLIIQYRIQLMGSFGAISAIASYLVSSKIEKVRERYLISAMISTVMLCLFIAAALLDLFYYNELLRGAVKAIVEFEKKHIEINMSTTITHQFSGGASKVIYSAYLCVFIPIVLFTVWSWYKYCTDTSSRQT